MSPSKILFYLCISFILGIFLESIAQIPQIFIWGILILGILLISISIFRGMTWTVLGFCALFIVIGILRFQISEFNIENDKLSKLNGKGQVVLTGVIYNEPDIRDTFQKLKIKVGESIILATTNRYPEYKYLDKIKITGKLETPQEDEDFSYKNYLMKDGIHSVMNFPKIEIIGKAGGDPFSAVYSGILFLKQKLRESIRNNFLPPQSLILEGTILGDNGVMSNDLKNKLNVTGLRHVIAVSGTHVVILSLIIMSALLAIGLWRGQAFYIAVIFICLYIVLTGLPASGIRAGVMGGLYLLSQKLGRQSMGVRVIVLACAVMLVLNPLLLFYDVGFQLSFLAVLGLIYLEPPIKFFIKKLVKKLPEPAEKGENLISIASATFAAQVFTLPVMVFNFGNISFVSPLTNILVLPIVSGLMILGFLSSLAGIFLNAFGWVLSVPCYFLLSYFMWVINFFSQQWMMKTFENVHWAWLLISYLAIALFSAFLNKKYGPKIV